MNLEQRISAFAKLGNYLQKFLDFDASNVDSLQILENSAADLNEIIIRSKVSNAWFTNDHVRFALKNWADALTAENLNTWLNPYSLIDKPKQQTVAIIMAGNLPLVGFHDYLSVLITGHKALIKLSSDDQFLLPYLHSILCEIEPGFTGSVDFAKAKLENFDAVIATGSTNTSRYFEYYFRNKPSIIRGSRNGVAVLTGKETKDQLQSLGDDIFTFFGMGCRSVSKLFVPQGYDFKDFFESIVNKGYLIDHHKYANNYDYNKAVYLMSLFPVLDNNFVVLKEDENFSSPIAVIFYETYQDTAKLKSHLDAQAEKIQCIVADGFDENEIPFGQAQQPNLWDYADGVDSIEFLSKIS